MTILSPVTKHETRPIMILDQTQVFGAPICTLVAVASDLVGSRLLERWILLKLKKNIYS